MRTTFLFPLALLMSSFAAQAQINMLAIDWHNFKGAKTVQTYAEGDKNTSSTKVTLDENGKVLIEENFWKGLPFSKTTYTYDKQGRVIERKKVPMTASDAQRASTYTYYYNDNKCEELRMGEDGVVYERIVSTLDSRGLTTSAIHYYEDGSEAERYEFEYDSRGNQTLRKCVDPGNDVIRADKRPVTIINRLSYDEHNNPVSFEISYDRPENGSSTQNLSYVYDAHGNWTKRTTTFSHSSGAITKAPTLEVAITY